MGDNVIQVSHLGQVLARIPGLLARLAFCLALGPASGGTVGPLRSGVVVIARRRQLGIGGVPTGLALQLHDAGL